MGRFSRKFKKALGNESTTDILNSGRTIHDTKADVLKNRKIISKQKFVTNNMDKLPKELLNMATNKNIINNKNENDEE